MYDPYLRDTPGLGEPSNDLIPLTPDDDTDFEVGIKSLRIWNPNETTASIVVITYANRQVTFHVPALSLWTEPLRVRRLLTASSAGVVFHGYTDVPITLPNTV